MNSKGTLIFNQGGLLNSTGIPMIELFKGKGVEQDFPLFSYVKDHDFWMSSWHLAMQGVDLGAAMATEF